MIVIGGSLGGAQAVQALLRGLPAALPVPVIVVLHRHRDSDATLTEFLQRQSALQVLEVSDKQPIESARVYLAPPDYHVLVEGNYLSLSIDDPVRHARPSIDVLFESAAAAHSQRVIAVVLTGGGADGAQGAASVETAGGIVLVQDPTSAASADMPVAAIAATQHAEILELDSIANRLVQLTM